MTESNETIVQMLTSRRSTVGLLAFLGFVVAYTMRVNLSVAILDIAKSEKNPVFEWTSEEKGIILSAFFYGYVMTQLIGGWLGAKIGGAKVFGSGVLVASILTVIMPLAAYSGSKFLIASRVVAGLFQGVMYPSIHAVWSKWAPPRERTRLASFGFSGSFFGTVIGFPFCGFLIKLFGWPSAFYIPGVIGIICGTLWFVFVRDSPEQDPRISERELKYLRESLADMKATNGDQPWAKILTSMPVWAMVCAHFCENWSFYTMITHLPTYLSYTLKFDLQDASIISSLPYLLMALTLLIGGSFVDLMRNYMSVTMQRKVCNVSAFILQAIFFVLAPIAPTATLSILCITFGVGIGAFAWTAFSVNPLDLAPQHASILMGLSNTVASLAGVLGPLSAGYFAKNNERSEWFVVFALMAAIHVIGACFYAIFASGEKQEWAETASPTKPQLEQPLHKGTNDVNNRNDVIAMERM